MRTGVRIGHLVLDGFELSRGERDALGPAIARELRRLAAEPVPGPPGRRAGDRGTGPGSAVDGIAGQVAAAVHQATAAARPAAVPAARRPGARRGRR
jgi:hypothetical protein